MVIWKPWFQSVGLSLWNRLEIACTDTSIWLLRRRALLELRNRYHWKQFVNPLTTGPGDFESGWVPRREGCHLEVFLKYRYGYNLHLPRCKNFMNFDPLPFEKKKNLKMYQNLWLYCVKSIFLILLGEEGGMVSLPPKILISLHYGKFVAYSLKNFHNSLKFHFNYFLSINFL